MKERRRRKWKDFDVQFSPLKINSDPFCDGKRKTLDLNVMRNNCFIYRIV